MIKRPSIHAILQRWVQPHPQMSKSEQKARAGSIEGIVSICVNLAMFGVKLIFGRLLFSHALVADAFHSLSDALSSVAIMIGLRASNKPPDKEHPFGHGRVEFITTLIMSGFLLVAGYEILKSSLSGLHTPAIHQPDILVYVVIVITILANECLTRMSFALAKITDSKALLVEGQHHRSDAWSSVLVLISMTATHFHILYMDSIVGIIISLWIMWTAISAARKAMDPLIGEAPSREELKALEKLSQDHPDIFHIHDIIYHKYGHNRLLSVHIEISDKHSLLKAHGIAEDFERQVQRALDATVVVHIDPVNPDHPRYQEVRNAIQEALQTTPDVDHFYALRIIDREEKPSQAAFCVSCTKEAQNEDQIQAALFNQLSTRIPDMDFVIHVAPIWAYTPKHKKIKKQSSKAQK